MAQDDEPPPFGVEWGHFEPACMIEEVGWSDGLGEDKMMAVQLLVVTDEWL